MESAALFVPENEIYTELLSVQIKVIAITIL